MKQGLISKNDLCVGAGVQDDVYAWVCLSWIVTKRGSVLLVHTGRVENKLFLKEYPPAAISNITASGITTTTTATTNTNTATITFSTATCSTILTITTNCKYC